MADYVEKNREYWTGQSPDYVESAEHSWATHEIDWGMFNVPDAELNIFEGIDFQGAKVIEMGCGTAYFSSWFAKRGARPVGIDITPLQLAEARRMQLKHSLEFPLIEGNAEEVPYPDESFDLAFSEYGASIWCDPYKWIPEAVRLLKPGGHLIFLRHTPLAMICSPPIDPISTTLLRPWFGLHRMDFPDGVEFTLGTGEMFRLLKSLGLAVENFVELQAPDDYACRYDHFERDWPCKYPIEEIWRARKAS